MVATSHSPPTTPPLMGSNSMDNPNMLPPSAPCHGGHAAPPPFAAATAPPSMVAETPLRANLATSYVDMVPPTPTTTNQFSAALTTNQFGAASNQPIQCSDYQRCSTWGHFSAAAAASPMVQMVQGPVLCTVASRQCYVPHDQHVGYCCAWGCCCYWGCSSCFNTGPWV